MGVLGISVPSLEINLVFIAPFLVLTDSQHPLKRIQRTN